MPVCSPPGCDPEFYLEAGARALYVTGTAEYFWDGYLKTEFQRDLNFKDVLVLAEVYGGFRIAPRIAFTYSFIFPTDDEDVGFVTGRVRIGERDFRETAVEWNTTTYLHKWEAEYFFLVGCNYRFGIYGLGELIVGDVEFTQVNNPANHADESYSKFLLGFGASGEYGVSKNIFLKLKAAYSFLDDTRYSVYGDLSARMFPDLSNECDPRPGCGSESIFSEVRPYGEIGYRFRRIEWYINEDEQFFVKLQGPYIGVGAIF